VSQEQFWKNSFGGVLKVSPLKKNWAEGL